MARNKNEFMELIKTTTFGVEIEMCGIKRESAARIAATVLAPTGFCRVWRKGTGYDKWTCTDGLGRDWDFVFDSSIRDRNCNRCGALNRPESCELNTPPLLYDQDMEYLQKLIRALRNAGAKSSAKLQCGIHIHVSGKRHDYKTIRNLVNLFYSNDELIRKALGIDPERSEKWCQPIKADLVEAMAKANSIGSAEDAWYGTLCPWQDRREHYNSSRYHILNLHRYFSTYGEDKNTVEIRAFNGELHAGIIRSYVLFVLSMNASALLQKNIRAVKNPIMIAGNEKFAMRTWLNRMGWTGEMFKNPHAHLIKNLSGDAAWRFGKNGDLYH